MLLLLAPACADTDTDTNTDTNTDVDGDPAVVLVAASLTDVVDDLLGAWNGTAVASEGGSQVLAAQVRAGAPVDVLLSADPAISQQLASTGLAGPPLPIARNGLAVVAVPGRGIDGPSDLAREELRVILADDPVPLGRYTREALQRLEGVGAAPPGTAPAVLAGADSLEDDARTVLAKVTTGEADAAIVYRTDAAAAERAGADITVIPWPDAADVTVTYTAQVIVDAPQPRAAEELLRFLRSERTAGIWREHGFDPLTADDG